MKNHKDNTDTGDKGFQEPMNRVEIELCHELRTPLIGILGFSELLMEDGSRDDVAEMASKINDCGTRLLQFIDVLFSATTGVENQLNKSSEGSVVYSVEEIGSFKVELLNRFRKVPNNGE
jgi:K+-sensing histidine kinase KdpD